MRELKICLYSQDSQGYLGRPISEGSRSVEKHRVNLGSVVNDQVYDLALTYSAYLGVDNDSYDLGKRFVYVSPRNPLTILCIFFRPERILSNR